MTESNDEDSSDVAVYLLIGFGVVACITLLLCTWANNALRDQARRKAAATAARRSSSRSAAARRASIRRLSQLSQASQTRRRLPSQSRLALPPSHLLVTAPAKGPGPVDTMMAAKRRRASTESTHSTTLRKRRRQSFHGHVRPTGLIDDDILQPIAETAAQQQQRRQSTRSNAHAPGMLPPHALHRVATARADDLATTAAAAAAASSADKSVGRRRKGKKKKRRKRRGATMNRLRPKVHRTETEVSDGSSPGGGEPDSARRRRKHRKRKKARKKGGKRKKKNEASHEHESS